MTGLGLDIGGANIKAADGRGWACSVPFAMWRQPERLPAELIKLLSDRADVMRIAVTMTGELCDCFCSKAEGVRHILAAVEQAASGREVSVYLVDGRLASLAEARQAPHLAAASNWHALANFACRYLEGRSGLLIDVGSTTTDIVPLTAGVPCPRGWNDTERLLHRELVYTGVIRTPICAVTPWLPWRGRECPIAAEVFATTADAYVLLGEVDEDHDATWTADGTPLTRMYARRRLARMLCDDETLLGNHDIQQLATAIRAAQLRQTGAAVSTVIEHLSYEPEVVVIAGFGEFFARALVQEKLGGDQVISLSDRLSKAVSACAPAHAVAVLAAEQRP